MNIKIILNFFSHNNIKFQPRTSKNVYVIASFNCSIQ